MDYIKLGGGCGNKAGRLLPDRRECCHLVCCRRAWYISCRQLHLDSLSFCSRRRSSYVLPVTKETIKYFMSAHSKNKSYQNDFNFVFGSTRSPIRIWTALLKDFQLYMGIRNSLWTRSNPLTGFSVSMLLIIRKLKNVPKPIKKP